jgi:Zn-dependent M28 family amino/carboxypeptidase
MNTTVSRIKAILALPLAFSLTLLAFGCAAPEEHEAETENVAAAVRPLPAGTEEAQAIFSADSIRGDIAQLASDDFEGRAPGSEGDLKTQQFLVDRMTEIGFQPAAADGGWLQTFDMVELTATAPETWTFETEGGPVELTWWDDWVATSGVQTDTAVIEDAELVFVGFGIQAPEYGWDDFGDMDMSGKVLVVMNNDPDWDDELFAGDRRLLYGRWTYKYGKADELGAAGTIIIHTDKSAGYPYGVVQNGWSGAQFEIPAGDEPRSQVDAWTTEEAMRTLMAAAGHDLDALRESAKSPDFQPVPLGIRTSLELANEIRTVQTANVLGVLPGSDPELSEQYVVFTAHHDHFGHGNPDDSGDDIYNGALDNASGTAQVLAIAEAFAALPEPPRRSIMLAFVAAEEQGLLGSAYYAANPTVEPGQFAANINYDGANIWGKNRDVTYIGYGKSSLDAIVDQYAGEQGRTVKPDQFPDKGFFYRSDQFNFAKIGVPAIYLDTGTEFVDQPEGWGREQIEAWTDTHYHQPSDELVDDWNFDGMLDDVILGFRAGLHIAEQDEMPTWNAGDEFEAARLEALAAIE